MPPSVLQHSSQSAYNEFATVSKYVNVVLGSTPTAGNCLIAVLTGQGANFSPTAPTGFTLLDGPTTAQLCGMATYYRVVQAGDSATVVCNILSPSADWCAAAVYEIAGSTASPIDTHALTTTQTAGGQCAPSATANYAGSLALAFLTSNKGTGASATPGTWTQNEFVDNNQTSNHFHPVSALSRAALTTASENVSPTLTEANYGTGVIGSLVLIKAPPTVTFNANGGTGSMSPETDSSPTALTTNTYTYSGYTFNGWNTAANGSGTAYANGATYPFTASATLYAQWTAVAYGNFFAVLNL